MHNRMNRLTTSLLLLVALPLSLAASGARTDAPAADGGKYISAVKLIGGNVGEISSLKADARRNGWTVIESDLNAGTRGDQIYLCYKTTSGDDYITDLYLRSGSNPVSNSITVDGRTYTLCPNEGGSHFTGIKGDLNSNAGGDDIHIYYTKASFGDGRAVSEIWFSASSSGAVCKDTGSTAYDLNKGAGGADIFMHFSTTAGVSGGRSASRKSNVIGEVKLIGGGAGEISALKANARRNGWTVIESNLNAGTRGDEIYLCYKTTSGKEYITDLYLSSGGNPVSGTITVDGRTYTLCPNEGGSHFTGIKGDLNSNAGGDDIHIYYTKVPFDDGRAVSEIWFNASANGAVCKDSGSTAYDLNKGAGGDDIFMHFNTK